MFQSSRKENRQTELLAGGSQQKAPAVGVRHKQHRTLHHSSGAHVTISVLSSVDRCSPPLYILSPHTQPCYVVFLHHSYTQPCYVVLLQHNYTQPCYVVFLHYNYTQPCYVVFPHYNYTQPCYVVFLHYNYTRPIFSPTCQFSNTTQYLTQRMFHI
jgi:hypothetical protein